MSDREDNIDSSPGEMYLPVPSWIKKEAERHGWLRKEGENQAEIECLKNENKRLLDQRARLVRHLVYASGQLKSFDDALVDAIVVMTSTYPWPSLEWVSDKLSIYDRNSGEVV